MKKSLNEQIREYNKRNAKQSVMQIVFDELHDQGYNVTTWDDVKSYERGADNEPVNYMTRRPYSGVNQLLLPTGEYLTWNQIQNIGGHVKKGTKSYIVVYCAPAKKTVEQYDNDEIEIKESKAVLKYYRVFNADDVEGLPRYDSSEDEAHSYEDIFEIA